MSTRTRQCIVSFVLLFIVRHGKVAAAAPPDSAGAKASASASAAAPGAPVNRVAMDLLDNRVHASAHSEGHLIINAASADFLKYVDGAWKTSWILGDKDQGVPAALVAGLSAQLFVPVDTDGDGVGAKALADSVLSFTGRALTPKQKLTVFVNEKAMGNLDVESDAMKLYEINVPAGSLKSGENRVRFTFRSAASVASGKRAAAAITGITLGIGAAARTTGAATAPATAPAAPTSPRTAPLAGEAPAPANPAGARVAETTLGGVRRNAIAIPGNASRLSYYVQVPEGALLELAHGSDSPGAHAIIRIAVDGQPVRQLLDAAVGSRWSEVSLPLAAATGHAARIDLVSRGGAVKWAQPRLVVRAPARPAIPVEPRFDHVFVWMVDTLRADKMRVYNLKTRVETPNYDAFAADATRFAWAQVPGTWSLPSHASLLTGVYPSIHKAVSHESKLSRDVAFIAEDLKKRGFKTAIFSSNGYVSGKWGFERGWDMYRNFIRESLPNGADYLWKNAKTWVLQNQNKPEFAYLATVDPHVAYAPKAEFLKKYWNKPYSGPLKPSLTGIQLGSIGAGKLKINDNDKAYLEALHDAEITQSDAVFGTFIADLKTANLYDKSVVIVVSDHGDEFGEHGRFGHGHSVYQELTHVPLVIRAPGRMPIGKVVHSDVEIMDVYTTMLDLAGAPVGPRIQGASLISLAWDEVGSAPRAALSMDGQVLRGLKVARYRLVAASGRLELYDQVEDRLEQKDVAAQRPIALRQMRGVLGLLHPYESRWIKTRWGTAANITADCARELAP